MGLRFYEGNGCACQIADVLGRFEAEEEPNGTWRKTRRVCGECVRKKENDCREVTLEELARRRVRNLRSAG